MCQTWPRADRGHTFQGGDDENEKWRKMDPYFNLEQWKKTWWVGYCKGWHPTQVYNTVYRAYNHL